MKSVVHAAAIAALLSCTLGGTALAQEKTQKPPLHGTHWMAITGKPLAATAGARMFERGGNAVDAACAMLAATSTMWDVLSWGGETQALIYNPKTGRIIAINGLGVAPTGATAEFFRDKGLDGPPEDGPLAAVTPGTPGALITMLAEFGTLSLAEVLAPSIELADGYAIDAETADEIEVREGEAQAVALLEGRDASALRRGARGAGCRRDLPPGRTSQRRCASSSKRKPRRSQPASRARRRCRRPTTACTAATSPRNSCAARARKARWSRPATSRTGA